MSDKRDNGGYYLISNSLVDYFIPLVGPEGIVLYDVYNRLQNRQLGYAFPSNRHLMSVTGFGNGRIQKANKKLQKYELITIKHRWGKSNRYYVHDPVVSEKVLKELEKLGRKPLVSRGVSKTDTPEDKLLPEKALGQGVSISDTLGQVYPKQIHSVSKMDTPVYPKWITNNTNLKRQTNDDENTHARAREEVKPENPDPGEPKAVVADNFLKEKEELAELFHSRFNERVPIDKAKREMESLIKKYSPEHIDRRIGRVPLDAVNPTGYLIDMCKLNDEQLDPTEAEVHQQREAQIKLDREYARQINEKLQAIEDANRDVVKAMEHEVTIGVNALSDDDVTALQDRIIGEYEKDGGKLPREYLNNCSPMFRTGFRQERPELDKRWIEATLKPAIAQGKYIIERCKAGSEWRRCIQDKHLEMVRCYFRDYGQDYEREVGMTLAEFESVIGG